MNEMKLYLVALYLFVLSNWKQAALKLLWLLSWKC